MALIFHVFALMFIGCRVTYAYVTCYQCGGPGGCYEPFNATAGSHTCVGLTCMKYFADCDTLVYPCEHSKVSFVHRSCTNVSIDYDNCASTVFSKGKVITCVCKSDRCNSATVIRPSNKMAVLIMAIVLSAILI